VIINPIYYILNYKITSFNYYI
ncbi:hypothetical protein C081_01785, partial [Brucella abortus F5/04-7]